MDELARFSHLVLKLQEAPLAPDRWNDVVSEIVAATGGSEGILFSPGLAPSHGGFWASRSILPHHMERYATYYYSKDVWRLARPDLFCVNGRMICDDELAGLEAVRRSEFYCDFLKQLDIGRVLCGVVHPLDSPVVQGGVFLSIFKPMSGRGFSAQQQELMKFLIPHVQAAFNTSRILGMHQRARELDEAVLNALATAALVIDQRARLLFSNEAADRLLSTADGLSVRNGALAGATARDTAAIHAFIAGFFEPLTRVPSVRVHNIERPSGKRPYTCFGHPLAVGSALHRANWNSAVVLFVRDPASTCAFEPEVLEQLHDLTHSEAVLACLLTRGLTLGEAAANRGISYETARTQLKSLFDKTGCHRQAELVTFLVAGNPI